ncbi:MAG: fructosamine kinase, partial [Chitinophagaceae bacterium]
VFTLQVPRVLQLGIAGQIQYLLLEWIEPASPGPTAWEEFGSALAQMHRGIHSYTGWTEDNYIGSLTQSNRQYDEWEIFFSECRIRPLVKSLYDAGSFTRKEMVAAESFCKRAASLFPDEPMALLHGDLWSGNKMFTVGGRAAIFDPAVYFGHREMDIGMTKLFGGFDHRFFDAYQEAYPLEKDWQQRLPIVQLYPVLVHAVLFGGHYVQSAANTIQHFS